MPIGTLQIPYTARMKPVLLLSALLLSLPAQADIRLPAVLSDGMVLQQKADATIWGWANPAEKVTVTASWLAAPAEVAADPKGRWTVHLKTPAADAKAAPQSITIKSGGGGGDDGRSELTIKNILIGEVWICSGQSNMEMPVGDYGGGYRGVANWQEELKRADHPKLRLFTVENTVSAEPQTDCKGKWAAANAESVKAFSATGYFFGVNVQKAINIPIGLISSDWGGTPAEAWTSADTLKKIPEWSGALKDVESLRGDAAKLKQEHDAAFTVWLKKFDEAEPGSRGAGWYAPDLDDSDWKDMTQPKVWDGDLANFDGTVWARRTIEIPAEWAGKDLTLELGPIDDNDTTWFNGQKVGEFMGDGNWATPRNYTIPAAIVKPGRAVIAVRMLDNQGAGGMAGEVSQLRLQPSGRWSGKVLALAGPWKVKVGTQRNNLPWPPRSPAIGPNSVTSLYNGMIAPLTPMAIRGAIWYQGESNRDRAFQYRSLFPAMIKDWRTHFSSGQFPFYFVQIAPFGYGNDNGEAAELREAQMMTLSLPNTGMAVTMDIGNAGDIHPNTKQEVGRRLALWAIAKTYGNDLECSGPTYKSMKIEGSSIRITFDHATGLTSGDKEPTCFTIAGEDRKFVPAKAVIEGQSVTVSSDAVPKPVAVRFGWGAADEPILKNKTGLPASSFRTDDWPGLTQRPPAKGSSHLNVRHEELALTAPIDRWDEAIPLGNGLMGGLLWGEGNIIRLSLDRGDLWDLRSPEVFKNPRWNYKAMQEMVAARDEKTFRQLFDEPYDNLAHPTKLPGGRVEVTLPTGTSAKEFRLNLRRAEATIDMGGWGGADARAFFSATKPVAMLKFKGDASIKIIRPPGLARLGYSPPTEGHDGDLQWMLQQAAEGLTYAVVVASHASEGETSLAIAIASTNDGPDPLTIAKSRVAAALASGYTAVFHEHEQWWKDFNATSSISIPDPELQAHYDLCRYYYGAASRTGAPPMPLQGVWTADEGGLPPWKGDYHNDLNTQMTYLAYPAAGLYDSGQSFLDFNWSLLPRYQQFARSFYDVSGAAIPGVMGLDGSPLGGWGMYSLSPTMGAWVAQAFYLHWRYTMDDKFLKERAYPFCAAIGQTLAELAKPDANGKLKLPLSSSPEIFDNSFRAWLKPNSNFDLSLMKWLFGALEEMATAAELPDRARTWRRLISSLDPLDTDGPSGPLTFAQGEPYTQSHRHFSHLMAIHPLGTLSIEGIPRDRAIIDASLDQVLQKGTSGWCGYSFSWMSCILARCGRPEQALDYLTRYQQGFILRNGFHCNGDQSGTGMSGFTYRPFTLEGNFLAMQAVHEMLLQSWGGVIRIFPAVSAAWPDVSFENLRAEGGFIITAKREHGRTADIEIEATRDGVLTLRNPFDSKGEWNLPIARSTGGILTFNCIAGQHLHGTPTLSP